jgi:hypothetical protein
MEIPRHAPFLRSDEAGSTSFFLRLSPRKPALRKHFLDRRWGRRGRAKIPLGGISLAYNFLREVGFPTSVETCSLVQCNGSPAKSPEPERSSIQTVLSKWQQ